MASTDEPPGVIVDETAAEQIVRLARERPGELVLLATGPLTNIGGLRGRTRSRRAPPGDRRHGRRGVGAREHVPACGGEHPPRPEAADRVFASAEPPPGAAGHHDDVSDHPAEMRRIDAAPSSPAVDLVRAMLPQYLDFNLADLGVPGFPLHDPTAAVIALDPHVADYLEAPVRVELDGTLTRA